MTIKNTEEIELQQLHPRREINFTNVTPVSVEIQIPVKDREVTIAGKAELYRLSCLLLCAKIHIINGKKGEFLAEKTNRKHKRISVGFKNKISKNGTSFE